MNKKFIICKSSSPWIKEKDQHIFGYELSIAKDLSVHELWSPHPFFIWIIKNNAEKLMLDALVTCCPTFPSLGYRGIPFAYTCPPPSGSIQATVFIVFAYDSSKKLRAVGCNFESMHIKNMPSEDFFGGFEAQKHESRLASYIHSEVYSRMTNYEVKRLKEIRHEAEKYGTMPIVMMAIDPISGPIFAIETALIKPYGSCDSSYEFVGEIL
jgi:hypothetical protein